MFMEMVYPGTSLEAQQKRQRMTQALITVGVMVLMLLCWAALTPASAGTAVDPTGGNTQIQNQLASGMGQIYVIFKAVLAPIAIVLVVWNVIKAMFLGDRGMESAKKGILTILCICAIVYLAPLIVTTVIGWFKGGGSQLSGSGDVWKGSWNP